MFMHINHLGTGKATDLEAEIREFGDKHGRDLRASFHPDRSNPRGVSVLGDTRGIQEDGVSHFETLPYIERVVPIMTPYKLASRDSRPEYNQVKTMTINVPAGNGTITIGGCELVIIAGPCAVEGRNLHEARERTLQLATEAKAAGAQMFRGGAFKPRTSPYSFQGYEEPALKILAEAREKTGLPIVSEIMNPAHVPMFEDYGVDVLQIGMRNSKNYDLIESAARTGKPILLKRGEVASLDDTLLSAEYALVEGNNKVMICERGVRPVDPRVSRNSLDLAFINSLVKATYLVRVADPSHGYGRSDLVEPGSRAAVDFGAQALLIETIRGPQDKGMCDFDQGITMPTLAQIARELKPLYAAKHMA